MRIAINMSEKTPGQLLTEKLLMKPENIGQRSAEEIEKANKFCEGYKKFLRNKTEREVVDYTVELLKQHGYTEFKRGVKYSPGDKVYKTNRGKALIMVTVGKKDISEGLRIGVSHIDSPRLDFKPNPLFEDTEMAYFKTHYYGGIKKYQWFAIPLSIRGTVILKDGTAVKVRIGDEPEDPIFCVTDLLPHLDKAQVKKPVAEAFSGEALNLLIGCQPFQDEEVSEKVKLNIANILFEKYGITEKDFNSAELCAVPAFEPKDLGFDRAMIGAYGHDDRVCSYTALMAEIDTKNPEHTTVTVFADKEETGSDGNTGMNSFFLKDFLEDLVASYGAEVRHVLEKSKCLSCDVSAAVDPAFAEVFERRNASYINHGAVVEKYGGGGGKYNTNDASAEMMGFIRSLLDNAGIAWQTGELGRIDIGGGGTVAKYVSTHNVDTVDLGVPVLSMHAPFEVVSKLDVYMTYLAIAEFYK